MKRVSIAVVAALVAVTVTSCVRAKRPALKPTPAETGATLWESPTNLPTRDLYYGPWGREHAPDPTATYTLVERKHTGVNLGMTVRDPQGREWSVKQPYPGGLDDEGPVEVTLSRLLSAIGYHQPPVYHLAAFTLKDDWGAHIEPGGRFRVKHASLKDAGSWRWEENPFIGSRPYQGLLALLMMFNSTDLKNSNNTLYELKKGERIDRWYVVRDIGAALGDTNRFAPRKGHVETFERQPFILGVNGGYVDFAYSGWYEKFVRDRIRPDDVVWASNLLAQLNDRQWQDAFRAGGYEPAVANRFIRKLREKVEQGRNVARRASTPVPGQTLGR
jgi:hypothetical protein